MKKKRLSVFSLLIALTLTLGACDDLEDLFPTGSDSDESTELTEDEDPNTGVNPNEDEDENEEENNDGNNDDDNDDDEKGNEPVNKDVTITLNPTSISLKENETEYFSVSLSDSEASILTVSPENATYIEVGPSGSDSEYYVKGLEAGSTSITITAGGEGFNTATASISVTVDYADSFTYQMYVENEASVPKTGWYYNSEASFTFLPKLYIYNRGVLTETKDLTTSEVELSVTNDEGSASSIISIDGLTISPAGAVGVVTLTLSYRAEIDGTVEPLTYTISVDEVYSETHSVEITAGSVPESITVGDSGFDIGVKLTTTTTAGSTEEIETTTVDATNTDVSISFNPEGSMTAAGLHIIPSVVSAETDVTITVTWTAYSTEEGASATATIKVMPKEDATYTLTITNENEFTNWYSDDSEKTMEISIVSSDESEGTIETSELISDGKIATISTNESVATVDGLTVTPVAKGQTTILVYWTEHTEAHATLSLSILEHSYKLEITNKTELEEDWSIEDGARSLSISLTSDREDIETNVSASNVTITYDTNVFSSNDNGFTLTPIKTAESTTITATWVSDTYKIGSEGTDSFSVTINDNVKVTSLSLDHSELGLEYGETGTLTASLTGLEGKTATSTDVTWTSDSEDVIVSGNGLTATVISYVYGASATITATSVENSNANETCEVTIAEQGVTMATYVNEFFIDDVVTTPDNEGVYVLGDGNGVYASSLTTTTAEYNSAAHIRVKQAEEGYYLLLNEAYLTSSLTTSTSAEEAAVFTISAEGVITTGSSALGFNGTVLALSEVTSSAYLIDVAIEEDVQNTSGGTYYLAAYINGSYHYATTYSSNTLQATESRSEAVTYTLTSVGGDEYYLSYDNNGSTTYIKISSSGNNLSTSTTASGCEIVWDSENGAFCNVGDTKGYYLQYSSSSVNFKGYASGNLTNNGFAVAKLIKAPEDEPNLIGIGLTALSDSVNVNETLTITAKTYPTCLQEVALTWTSSADDYASVEDGVVSGLQEHEGVMITASHESISASIVITINGADESYIGTLDFTTHVNASTTAFSQSTLQTALTTSFTGTCTIVAGSTTQYVYPGSNGSGNGVLGSAECFQVGGSTSGNYGTFTVSFKDETNSSKTFDVGKIVIVAAGYDDSSTTLTIGGVSFAISSKGEAHNSWSEFAEVSNEANFGSEITIQSPTSGKHRILLHSITFYAA